MADVARLFLRLGVTAFGGPSAHVALMETEVVTRRGWLTRAQFLDQQALVQALPGPNSTELAIHIGHLRAGWRGAMVAGLCFVLPSVVMVWALAALSGAAVLGPSVRSVLWWLMPVVVVIIAEALWKFGKQSFTRAGAPVVMPLTALAACVLPADLLVLAVGAVVSVLVGRRGRGGGTAVLAGVVLCGALAAGAQGLPTGATAPGPVAVLLYFLRAGLGVFGSGYVLLAYLQRDLVEGRGWLTMPGLLQASALAQVTPGPLFSMATAAGYLIGGSAGAVAATVGIFAPAFASVAIGGPVRRLIDRSVVTRLALDGVVVASVALLGRAVVGCARPLQPAQWVVCGVAGALLFGFRVPATRLLVGAVAIGLVGAGLHFFPS